MSERFGRKSESGLTCQAIVRLMVNRDVGLLSSVVTVLHRGIPNACIELQHFDEGKFVFVEKGDRHSGKASSLLIG